MMFLLRLLSMVRPSSLTPRMLQPRHSLGWLTARRRRRKERHSSTERRQPGQVTRRRPRPRQSVSSGRGPGPERTPNPGVPQLAKDLGAEVAVEAGAAVGACRDPLAGLALQHPASPAVGADPEAGLAPDQGVGQGPGPRADHGVGPTAEVGLSRPQDQEVGVDQAPAQTAMLSPRKRKLSGKLLVDPMMKVKVAETGHQHCPQCLTVRGKGRLKVCLSQCQQPRTLTVMMTGPVTGMTAAAAPAGSTTSTP